MIVILALLNLLHGAAGAKSSRPSPSSMNGCPRASRKGSFPSQEIRDVDHKEASGLGPPAREGSTVYQLPVANERWARKTTDLIFHKCCVVH
jgi:hypothetical protein